MPWFKVDDQLATHPKVAHAGLAAMGLWVKAGSWCAQHLTDGFVPNGTLRILGANKTHAAALVRVGLWIEVEGGYQFRDWLDYQPSRAHVQDVREKRRKAGRRGGRPPSE
jgi:hypothetical protein